MFEEREEARKLGIAMIQFMVVLFVATLVRMLPNTDLQPSGVVILAFLHIVAFYFSDAYYRYGSRGYLDDLVQVIKYNLFYTLGITFLSFMLEEGFIISRRGMVYFITLNVVAIYVSNLLIKEYRNRIYPHLRSSRKLLLLTDSVRANKLWQHLQAYPYLKGTVVAVSILDKEECNFSLPPSIKIVLPEKIIDYINHSVIDEVLVSLSDEQDNIQDWVSHLELMGVDVSVVINSLDFPTISQKRVQQVAGLNVVTFSTKFYHYSHILAKRALDIVGSLLGLLICGLVGIFVAPLIKKDGGSVIFAQKRVGQNGRIFKFYKFRSMYVDAEERKKELMAQNTMSGSMFKMDDDPRITPIGKFIRKTSIDELPQFWNVLRGDMSLVGTRPPTIDEYETYTPEQKRRLSFKPGITGLWQVSGRSKIKNFDEIVKLDVAYIDGWTIWSDIKILLKTVKVVLLKDGAK